MPKIVAVFELHNKNNTINGDELKIRIEKNEIITDYISIGSGGKSGASYQQIYFILIPIENIDNIGFKNSLRKSLEQNFFNHKNNFILKAITELKEIIKEQSNN